MALPLTEEVAEMGAQIVRRAERNVNLKSNEQNLMIFTRHSVFWVFQRRREFRTLLAS